MGRQTVNFGSGLYRCIFCPTHDVAWEQSGKVPGRRKSRRDS